MKFPHAEDASCAEASVSPSERWGPWRLSVIPAAMDASADKTRREAIPSAAASAALGYPSSLISGTPMAWKPASTWITSPAIERPSGDKR